MWLGYIKSSLVDELASCIRAPQSKFYNGVQDAVAQALALRVDSGFSLLSVADPNGGKGGVGGGPGAGLDGNAVGAESNSSQTRKDAVIGVVSALSAIALFVLLFLLYRSRQRRNELAHHRLGGGGGMDDGSRPGGREFDRDSVGGARRRSYYYAEDSLRGWQAEHEGESVRSGEGGHHAHGRGGSSMGSMNEMTQRRLPVGNQAISAPVLGANTMNW